MRRGDVVIIAAGGGFGGKPRPALIVQDDLYAELDTVVVIPFTSVVGDGNLRLRFTPDAGNGLGQPSDLMIDIPVTVRRDKIGQICGKVSAADLARVDRAMLIFLGLA